MAQVSGHPSFIRMRQDTVKSPAFDVMLHQGRCLQVFHHEVKI